MPGQESAQPIVWLRELFREHPALVVSGLYVGASMIGRYYSWDFLPRFGINVFNYAEISDFLLVSLKKPFTWGLTLMAVVLVTLDNAASRRVAARENCASWLRWYGSERYRALNYFAAIMIVVIFLNVFATFKAREVRDGEGNIVDVILANEELEKQVALLGTTGQFMFFYRYFENRVVIHPNENVLTITKPAPSPTAED